ncbi:MAG: gliding motility protein GldN [Sphingobacteriales bacterium]|nr:gliding motility protein GldN [Sphingobacteriales bacterium]
MKKIFLSIVIFLMTFSGFAQKKPVEPIYSIFQKAEEAKTQREDSLGKSQKECAPALPKVRSDDIIFAKRITRDIYFADPANRFLVPSVMDRNLIDILMKGIRNNDITAYQSYDASANKLQEPIDPTLIDTLINTQIGQFTSRQYGDMKGLSKLCLRIVEDWYFDTNRSEFKSFIFAVGLMYAGRNVLLGIPKNDASKDLSNPGIKLGEAGAGMSPLFWVNYPTIRDYLCKFRVYNQNEKIRYSFDDVFQLRYFSSLIIEESNPDGYKLAERPDLKSGLDKLLEADRIKRSLIQFEQNMWEQ